MTQRLGVVGKELDFSDHARWTLQSEFDDDYEPHCILFTYKKIGYQEAYNDLRKHLKRELTQEEIERIK